MLRSVAAGNAQRSTVVLTIDNDVDHFDPAPAQAPAGQQGGGGEEGFIEWWGVLQFYSQPQPQPRRPRSRPPRAAATLDKGFREAGETGGAELLMFCGERRHLEVVLASSGV